MNTRFSDCIGSEGRKMKHWLCRFLLVFVGGALGGIATLTFAFGYDGIPFTTNGMNEVLTGAAPIGAVCGCVAVILMIHCMNKRKPS
jgi:hypothetical protein